MPQRRPKAHHNIDVQVQEQYEDDEKICQCFQTCKPPPPPGREDLWELQFCRWWGWNWVRKRQIEECKKGAPKKNFKELCDCLRFRRGEMQVDMLQNLYNTPSHSVVVQTTNSHHVTKIKCDSFRNLEMQRNASQKNAGYHGERCKNVESWVKAKDELNCSSEECCGYITEGYRSSTDESIEYIKINCCPCHHKEETSGHLEKAKFTCETQTSKPATNVNVTQTKQSNYNVYSTKPIRKRKKKRICLICCHCMQHDCCKKCRHNSSGKEVAVQDIEKLITKENGTQCQSEYKKEFTRNNLRTNMQHDCPKKCKHQSSGKEEPVQDIEEFIMKENATQCQSENKKEFTRNNLPINPKKNPMKGYEGYLNIAGRYPYERLLYCDISKFARSPQKFYNTRSDIMDKLHRLKIEETFLSPMSGEIYNLTPMKVDSFEIKPTIFPEPIDVTADIKHLKKLENGFQTDRESRVMLDAICDAILSNNRCNTTSSTILNEVTYSLKEPEPCTTNQMFKNTEDNSKLPLNKPLLDETNYFNIWNDNSSNKCCNNTQLNSFSNNKNQEDINDTNIDDVIQSLMLNYETTPEQDSLKKLVDNNWTHKMSNIVTQDATKPNIRYDEFTSSLQSNRRYMNEKSKEMENWDILNTNINDIFYKIEEIIIKSKINDNEIQNVINTIPKRAACRLSSEEIIREKYLDGCSFTNPSPKSSTFIKNTVSNSLEQNDTTQIKGTHKQKKSFRIEPSEEENEKKMLPAKKRKKNSILHSSPVKKIDKFKSNKKK